MYQRATTGSVTRLIEAIICGIPVIANFDAAKDYLALPEYMFIEIVMNLFRIF